MPGTPTPQARKPRARGFAGLVDLASPMGEAPPAGSRRPRARAVLAAIAEAWGMWLGRL